MSATGYQEIAPGKGLFRIGQVSRLTDTKPFVLRYWETEFPMLQPVKSPKGHRLYRRQDVETVLLIKRLLYDEGFTIAGARRHLRDSAAAAPAESAIAPAPTATPTATELEADIQAGAEAHEEPLVVTPAAAAAGAPALRHSEPPVDISRKVLLDLRDSLRAFLTLLENE